MRFAVHRPGHPVASPRVKGDGEVGGVPRREVPHVPGMRAVIPQQRRLGGCGKQPVPEHANILSTATDISGEVKRRFFPCPKGGFFTSQL